MHSEPERTVPRPQDNDGTRDRPGLAASSAFPGWSIVIASGLVVSFEFIDQQIHVAFCHHVDSVLLAILVVIFEKCCKSHRGVCFIQGNVFEVVVVGCHLHQERNSIACHAVVLLVMLQFSLDDGGYNFEIAEGTVQ